MMLMLATVARTSGVNAKGLAKKISSRIFFVAWASPVTSATGSRR